MYCGFADKVLPPYPPTFQPPGQWIPGDETIESRAMDRTAWAAEALARAKRRLTALVRACKLEKRRPAPDEVRALWTVYRDLKDVRGGTALRRYIDKTMRTL